MLSQPVSIEPEAAHDPKAPGQQSPDQPSSNRQAQDTHYYRGILHDLIDMGTDLARMVHRQAMSQAEATTQGSDSDTRRINEDPVPDAGTDQHPMPQPDLIIAFDRIARAIRRTIALARKVANPPPPHGNVEHVTGEQQRILKRKRIIRDVEDAIQRAARDNEVEKLHAELSERLDAPDLDDDIDHRPAADIIAEICRDLGIAAQPGTRPWKRRTPQDIAALCARAAMPRRARPTSPSQATATGNDPPAKPAAQDDPLPRSRPISPPPPAPDLPIKPTSVARRCQEHRPAAPTKFACRPSG